MDGQQRVVVCDDSGAIRELLGRLVDAEPGLVLAGQAADGLEAEQLVCDLQPDLVVLDIDMPHRRGDEVLAAVRARGFRGRVVVFSGDGSLPMRASVLFRLGADAIVAKGDLGLLRAELAAGPATAPPLAA